MFKKTRSFAVTLVMAMLAISSQTVFAGVNSCTECNVLMDGPCLAKNYLPFGQFDPDPSSIREWSASKGNYYARDNMIGVRFQLDSQSMETLGRGGFGLEIEVVEIGGSKLHWKEYAHNLPENARATPDSEAFDSYDNTTNAILIRNPENLRSGINYYVLFFFDSIPESGVTIQPNIVIDIDSDCPNAKPFCFGVEDTEVCEYYQMETDSFVRFTAYPDGREGVKWDNKEKSDRYTPILQESNGQWFIGQSSDGGGSGTSLLPSSSPKIYPIVNSNPPPVSIILPNLQIKEFNLHDAASNLLTENVSLLWPNQTYELHNWLISKEADCINGAKFGDDTVKTDTFYKIAMSEDEGDWIALGRNYTQAVHMDKDDAKKEILYFTVPPEATGKRVYFRSKVDSADIIKEANEEDNWSDVEFYPVQGVFDLTISYARLTKGRTALNQFDHYGIEMWVKNLGFSNCPVDIRSAYYLKKPGATTWAYLTDDGTSAHDLVPNKDNYEVTLDEPFIADVTGTYQCMICADSQNAAQEINENNNCTAFSFNVLPNGPDLVISEVGIKEGTTIAKGTYIHPWAKVKNIGNRIPASDFRIAYYIDGDKRTDDSVKASQVAPGMEQKEEVLSNIIKLGNTGTRTCTVCADYEGKVTEQNESNNCRVITILVK